MSNKGIYTILYFPYDTRLAHKAIVQLNFLSKCEESLYAQKKKTRKICEATYKQLQNTTAQVQSL
jgi:hypothetical protein